MHIDIDVQDFCQLVICSCLKSSWVGIEILKKKKGIKKNLLGSDVKYCDNGKIFS